jgi:hypothetical protein
MVDVNVLEQFGTKASSDLAKQDLELVHLVCGETVCDVEDGDNLLVLAATAADHICSRD